MPPSDAPSPSASSLSGEKVPVLPENAARIREAVHRLRADLRRAQEDVDTLTSPELASLQTCSDAWFRLAPRQEETALSGLAALARWPTRTR